MIARAARLGASRSWRFHHLGTRLTVLYTALFVAAMLAIAFVAQVMVSTHARESVRAELGSNGSVFERLWALRAQSLGDAATVLAHDFGFRAAVASGDRATIASAVANLRARAGVGNAFVVDSDGNIFGDGAPALLATMAKVPARLAGRRRDAVVVSGRDVYRVVVSPVLAPVEIGSVVFAVKLDRREMEGLERLSAIPIAATVLRRDAAGHWVPATGGVAYAPGSLDRFIAGQRRDGGRSEILDTPAGSLIALAKPLASADGQPEAMLLLTSSLGDALAPYRRLQAGIVAVGLVGLALVLWGSRRLAATIARPIVALDAAARALELGDRAEVEVVGADEVGRLAASFNRMSAGIVERENRITRLAFNDTLTGLPNRVSFREQLETALARQLRCGEELAVLLLDLDGFKVVNDTLGHPAGDELLRAVGTIVAELAKDGIVARLSGDEFAIALAHGFAADRPRALSQAIIDRLHEPIAAAGHTIPTGASIGIAVAPADGGDAATLLKNADLALYRAKQDGRGVFRFFEPALDAAARRRRQIELDLREALRLGQFHLDYQPVFDLKAGHIGGFEALLRWDHPERGAVPPIEFIPIAEESGLIAAMGEWVLHQACREAMRWPGELRIAVNVSPLQMRNSGFVNIVVQALARSGLPPQRLEIEITESVFLEGTDSVLDLLHRLHALGVRIALDDFGTGYSSLSYLRSFPFDKIKIDRSFIANMAEDSGAAAIVHAIVELASAFHMETTAEGVESEEQLARLREQGCDNIQGYLFSRPLGVEALNALLLERHSAAA